MMYLINLCTFLILNSIQIQSCVCACVYRSLVGAGRGQKAQQQGEKCRQDFSKCTRSVGHHNLPNMQGGLSYYKLCVWPSHIKAREHTVPSLHSQRPNNGLRSTTHIVLNTKKSQWSVLCNSQLHKAACFSYWTWESGESVRVSW